MEIIRCSRSAVVGEIGRLKSLLSTSRETQRAGSQLERAQSVFSRSVDENGIAIRCTDEELPTLVSEYLEMLSQKHHLAVCVFVGKGVSVYSIKQIDRLRQYAVYSLTLPCDSPDDKIVIFVFSYDTYEGEVYDIDLISRRFCS